MLGYWVFLYLGLTLNIVSQKKRGRESVDGGDGGKEEHAICRVWEQSFIVENILLNIC